MSSTIDDRLISLLHDRIRAEDGPASDATVQGGDEVWPPSDIPHTLFVEGFIELDQLAHEILGRFNLTDKDASPSDLKAYAAVLVADGALSGTVRTADLLALLSRLEQAEQQVARVREALTEVQTRGENIRAKGNNGSIYQQERAARGEGYLETTRLAFHALDGEQDG